MIPSVATAQTVDELYASGSKARQAQHFDEAAELLQRVLALQPENTDALVQLGFAELGRGNLPAARAAFSKALALAPSYSDAKFGLAEIEFRAGDFDAALVSAEQLVREQPGNGEFSALAANIRKARQVKRDQAAKASKDAQAGSRSKKQARRPGPDPVAALMAQGRKRRDAGKLAEAERIYRAALRLAPKNTDVLVALGLIAGSERKFDEAGGFFRAALVIAPGLLDARLGQVRLAIWQGDVPRARLLIDEVVPSAHGNVEARVLEARISFLEGNYGRAEQSFEQAIASNPKNAEALVGIGDARQARGDDAAAREFYQQALSLEPGSHDIMERLSQPPPRNWRLDIGSEVSDLTNGLGTWSDSSIGLSYRVTPETAASVHTRLANRFGQTDVQIEGRIDQAFSRSFSAYGLVAGTPDSDFLARYSVGAGASWEAIARKYGVGPLLLNVDARYDEFAAARITTVSPWAQAYFFDGRLGLSARWVHASDDTGTRADGYVLRTDFAVTPRFNVFAGYGDAPEISEGTLVPTRTVFGGASWDVTDELTLRASLGYERRPAFDRDIFALGLTRRF